MAVLQIGVLGELTITRDGTPLAITGPGRRALLALLAARRRVVSRDRIIDGLWGDDPPASAIKVVQTHVSQLRRVLEPDREEGWELLVTHPSGYELAVAPESVDAARFEAAIRDAAELADQDAVPVLRDALALWRGPPYAGIERPFAAAEAARLEQLRVSALSRCLAGELERGRHREVEAELCALVAEHPLDESFAELLMLALYRGGQQAEALAVYDGLRRRLAQELGADPGPGLARLHERILRHHPDLGLTSERHRGPRQADPRARPAGGNLPAPRSSFIGREREAAEVAEMLRGNRLTTLVGAGGAGKTRLALRAAADAAGGFDGAWFVGLAALDDAEHLDGHCLTELGILDQMDRPPGDTLRGWVGDRRLLLVLDNCEHLADAVATLVDGLLTGCPRLHVLATSRQPLHCPGERQWRVPALGLPEAPTPAAVSASEAGRLFVDRAAEVRPGFVLDITTAPAVHQICRRLDGIPLAIELAAVRMTTMTAAELAAGLDRRFGLLTSGSRTALPRHRTLLATTDWSYGLLSAAQQRLLRRLSVFVADVDADAVTDVCGWPPLDPAAVPGLLADLVDHSLVEAGERHGRTRYRLLETVREYGRERLGAEAETLAERYGEWVTRLVEATGANAQLDTVTWYSRLDGEFVHLQGAFAAAMRRGDAETALRIASGSGWALIIIGRFHRLREWLRAALALARRTAVDDRALAQGLMMAAAVAGIDHRFDGTLDLLAEARQRFVTAGSLEGELWVDYWLAATLAEAGELDEALAQIRETSAAAGDEGCELIEANARAVEAELIVAAALARGRLDLVDLGAADAALARARELVETHGMQELAARVGLSEALVTALGGDPVGALPRAHRELDGWRTLGRGNRLILGLVATAKVALLADRPQEAWPLVTEAISLIAEFAWSAPLRGAAEVLAVLAAPHEPETAAVLLGAAGARAPTHRWRMPTDLDPVRASLIDALGSSRFERLCGEGGRLSLDEVVAQAARAASGRG